MLDTLQTFEYVKNVKNAMFLTFFPPKQSETIVGGSYYVAPATIKPLYRVHKNCGVLAKYLPSWPPSHEIRKARAKLTDFPPRNSAWTAWKTGETVHPAAASAGVLNANLGCGIRKQD